MAFRLLSVLALLLLLPDAAVAQRCADEKVCIDPVEQEGGAVDLYVENRSDEPLIVSLDVSLENMRADAPTPHAHTIPPRSRARAFGLRRLRDARAWRYTYRFQWRPARRCAEGGGFCILARQEGRALTFEVENLRPLPVAVELSMGRGRRALGTHTVYGDARAPIASVELRSAAEPWQYRYRWTPGVVGAAHDDAYVYALPFASGARFGVGQSYDGAYSHRGQHAIDFVMPEGTPVHAARGGIVLAAVDTHRVGGPDRRFQRMANHVSILHSDGTVGDYAHLMPGGVRVRVGDAVRRGQLIGLSGSTGFASGPHLHFEVFRLTEELRQETVPVRFDLGRREGVPEAGRRYRAE